MKAFNSRSWQDKNVTIAGLGTFGGQLAAAKFFARLGAQVTVTDKKPAESLAQSVAELDALPNVRLVLGGHQTADFTTADLVVASPAIPEDSEFLRAAEAAGVEITHEMDIFFSLCPAPIIGVTGSNGKSTTTALLAHILEKHARRTASAGSVRSVRLGGNIGRSLLLETGDISPEDTVVLELSSFQLEDLGELELSPRIAVVTNLSPNHLDRHGTFENYVRAKRNIARFQTPGDTLVLNADDPHLADWCDAPADVVFFGRNPRTGKKGVFISGGSLVSTLGATKQVVKVRRTWKLPGIHNLANLAAAVAAAGAVGVPLEEAVAAAGNFQPLPHRLEYVATVSGVKFYNDSIATTPESAEMALSSFAEPIVLIAGGYDKGLDLRPFARTAARSAKALVAIGRTGPALAEEASRENPELPVARPAAFTDAVRAAFELAGNGDVVVMSPACASYDEFENFRQRGERFRSEIQKLSCELGGNTR